MNDPSPNLPVRVIDHEIRAFMSETKRSGPWTPGSTTFVKATFAEVNLDLREAVLPEGGEVCIDVEVLVGSITVTIPPSWAVIQEVEILLGSYEEEEEKDQRTAPAPVMVLRVVGRIRLGTVEVRRRLSGEGWLGATRRRWRLRGNPKPLPPSGD